MTNEEFKTWIRDYEVPFQFELLVCLAPCLAFAAYLLMLVRT